MEEKQEKKRIYFDHIDRYVSFWSEPRMSRAHIYMISEVILWLKHSKEYTRKGGDKPAIYVIPEVRTDKIYPDITTNLFDIEVETGLKHSYKDLKDRIARNPKMVIVVLPNQDVKARYVKNCKIRKQKLKFCSMKELPHCIHNVLRNIKPSRLPP